ncbi:hypothetical protein QOZ80_4BG0348830 [Eleusine coracana subsp. coracana]|nr:hypothetical protein QOZ80_4BG0348830 [Eleusine coracana subsp. coracana]
MHYKFPRFVPTTSSFRLPTRDRHSRHVWDCRHGRVLLYDYDLDSPTQGFVVWDPITGDQHHGLDVPDVYRNGAVICTAAGCDHHRGCIPGGPFIVAFAGVERIEEYGCSRDAHADFYSSETGRWSHRVDSIHLDDNKFDLEVDRPAALVGDSLYFVANKSGFLLRFWYGPLLRWPGYQEMRDAGIRSRDILTVIEPPLKKGLGKVIVMTAEGGGLGLACLNLNRIALWARENNTAGPKGDADVWVKRRTIDLRKLIPLANPKRRPCLSGVIPGDASVIFVSTEDGVVFKIELEQSLQARKVSDMGTDDVKIIYPFVSFYTETLLQRLASGKAPAGSM